MKKTAPSAVLIPLVREKNNSILFEVRSKTLKHQPGEICLPGGRVKTKDGEPVETWQEAAIREAAEELLLKPSQIKTKEPLPPQLGPDGSFVYPVPGELSDYVGTFSKDEVERLLYVPLDFFLETEPECYAVDLVTVPREGFPYERIPGGRDYPWRKKEVWMRFYDYEGTTIWGLTAAVMECYVSFLKEHQNDTKNL